MADPSLLRFRAILIAACGYFETFRQQVNDLNVFPVADGDTGDNMSLTLRSVLEEVDRLVEGGGLDEIGREQIVDSVARAALLGARGNSGVILSQLIRGAAEELISRPGELVDPVLIGAAIARAADRAYASVREPAEGTILTVVRAMAHRIASELAHVPDLYHRLSIDEQDAVLADVLEKALEAGQESLKRGPEILPALRDAGVVDAGGFGLTIFFVGVVAALRGDEPQREDAQFADNHSDGVLGLGLAGLPPARVTHPQHESSTFRYCTNFAVTGVNLKPSEWVERLEKIGDSVLVVGDHSTLRVHVHTDSPESVTSLFVPVGSVQRLDVADMHLQMAARTQRLTQPSGSQKCGALALVASDGIAELFRGMGITPLNGGKTLNPSTYEILAGIHGIPSEEVVVLPNSSNVIMSAERAAELSDKKVTVVPSRSQQAGLAISVTLDPAVSAHENAVAMNQALDLINTGSVTFAARDDKEGRFQRGDAVGFIADELIAWGEPAATLKKVFDDLARDNELLTVIAGENAPLDRIAVAAQAPADVEFEYSFGGQPNFWWLIAAE